GARRAVLDLCVALILSRLVIAFALAVAAAAAVGSGSGGEVTALASPEVFAEDPGGSVTQAVGILLAATAAFGVSAFSPLLIARLLPLTEAAVVAQGVRSGPVRAGQQGMSVAHSARMLGGHRFQQLASGPSAASAGRAGAGVGAAGAMAAAPVTAGVTAVKAAGSAAHRGATAMTST